MARARPGVRLAPPADRPAGRHQPRLGHSRGVAVSGGSEVRGPTPDERILQGGRAKAYRPLPQVERRRAFEAGLAAYERGDFFEAHELWEPAWMGTRDVAERELIQGLIKLAAAFVHQARGNPAGIQKNLRGARARIAAGTAAGSALDVDVPPLLDAIDTRLAEPGSSSILIPRHGSTSS